ncbi:prepilin-type N-terminal cleavage/methylation domain-containing protein [Deinococcus yavapaiensis]|uniref:Prepilin-type N-terminal cleavage/methylation domain-containing protein n=1 Tax=Deinococcus yavapaiensis KR-236 TaxID=694435 RepID=A0A318SJH6_9DEIO|nr:prepilin-type N-terminal cleavage/methylation domain-containing protein [Deinococcus yavapaiensis]PYE54436.1 prepilin-type N-terminal cleavage/methylation domain-containing protein [Deinococcus yavapaiensis KR-236]
MSDAPRHRPPTSRETAFTLVEVLVALALLALVLTVVAPLSGLFGMARASETSLTLDARLFEASERVRAAWRNPANYAGRCGVTVDANVRVTASALDGSSGPTPASTCSTFQLHPPALLRVRVALGETILVFDVARPEGR